VPLDSSAERRILFDDRCVRVPLSAIARLCEWFIECQLQEKYTTKGRKS